MTKETICVCGTGIAGMATALGLTKAGYNAVLVGPRVVPAAEPQDTYHPRVYAISISSQQFLERLGIWALMDQSRITPVEAMEVYGDGDGAVHLHAWQAARPTLTWIVESGEMERALLQAINVFGVPWHPEKFQRLEARTMYTDSGRAVPFDALVGADGARSAVRDAVRIRHSCTPYGDTGVVVHLNCELGHQNIALQWFTGDSVLALLPMPDTAEGHQVSMVWSMPAADATSLLAMPDKERDAALAVRLQAVTSGRLGKLRVRSPMFGFPLTLEKSDMVAPHVALVGDAAHRVHPLAGQGLNLGLGDVKELISVLTDKEPYRSAGDLRVLHRYRRARAEPILAMRLATDGLHKLFSVQATPVVWARNLGMQCVDRVPLIKRLLISKAQ